MNYVPNNPDRTGIRAAIYARVSKDLREGRSVSEQESDCRRDVERHGWTLAAVLADNNVSASRYSKKDRPDWMRLMSMIQRGEVDAAVFWEISRGTRARREWAEFAELAIDQQLLICVGGRVYEATNPQDMEFLDNMVARGVGESGMTRERILRTVRHLAEQGEEYGTPGYGYRREYDPRTGRLIRQLPDPHQAAVVQEIAGWVVSGRSLTWIIGELNRRGEPTDTGRVAGKPYWNADGVLVAERAEGWTMPALKALMSRPALMGRRTHKGKIIEVGGWEPILTPAQFWAVQDKLRREDRRRTRPRDGAAKWLLSGIAVCDVCGGWMRAVPRSGRSTWTYRCNGLYRGAPMGHVTRDAAALEEHVEVLLVREFSRPDVLEVFRAEATPMEQVEHAKAMIGRLVEERRQLDADVAAGLVAPRIATLRDQAIDAQIAEWQAKAQPRPVDPFAEQLAALDAGHVLRVWRGWGLDQRRAALRAVAREVRVLRVGSRVGARRLAPDESVRVVFGPSGG